MQCPRWCLRGYRTASRIQGLLLHVRPLPGAHRPDPRAGPAFSHTSGNCVPRLRHPTGRMGSGITDGRGSEASWHRSPGDQAEEPSAGGRTVRPGGQAGGRQLASGAAAGRRGNRLGKAHGTWPRPGNSRRRQGVGDHRGLLRDRSPACRRQRHGPGGDLRHGTRCAHGACSGGSAGTGRWSRSDQDRHGRHGDRPLRPANLSQPVRGLHGHGRARGMPRHPRQAAGDGLRSFWPPPGQRANYSGDGSRPRSEADFC